MKTKYFYNIFIILIYYLLDYHTIGPCWPNNTQIRHMYNKLIKPRLPWPNKEVTSNPWPSLVVLGYQTDPKNCYLLAAVSLYRSLKASYIDDLEEQVEVFFSFTKGRVFLGNFLKVFWDMIYICQVIDIRIKEEIHIFNSPKI